MSEETGVTRRDLVVGAAALAGAAASAGIAGAAEHTGAHTGGHPVQQRYTEAKAYKKHQALVAAANTCVADGQACISHCFETFLEGDTTMAECAFAVEQMLHVCKAMAFLGAYDSKNLKPMAQACLPVCQDCEKECRVHEEHQPECRKCADACAAVVTELRKVLG